MSPRAPSAPKSPPAAAPVDGDPAVLAVALEAAITLARTTSSDRAAQDAAQLLRRATGAETVAIGLRAPDAPSTVLVSAHVGFASPAEAQAALDAAWRQGDAAAHPVASESGEALELHVPIVGSENVLGLVLVGMDRGAARDPVAAGQLVAAIARPLAVVVERATAVHRAEERIRLDAIGDVAAGLAHELRNPLFGISSAAQLLRYRVTEDPVVEKNVGRILREVERLNTMVTALLEYGRPSPMHTEPGDPDAVWDEVLSQQRGRLESKALRVRRQRPEGRTALSIDRAHLAQAFTNLLDNAIDAAPEGTDLALSSELLPTGAWRMTLANAGNPIPPDVRQRAFELFFSTKSGGTGVGLPLSRRIVEEHGGTIRLESDARSGTVATVILHRNHA